MSWLSTITDALFFYMIDANKRDCVGKKLAMSSGWKFYIRQTLRGEQVQKTTGFQNIKISMN